MNIHKNKLSSFRKNLFPILLILLLMLTACSDRKYWRGIFFDKIIPESGTESTESTTGNEDQPDSDNLPKDERQKVQADFNDYLDGLFRENVTGSSLTLNLRIENPENYGITDNPARLAVFSADYFDNAADEIGASLSSLAAHDRSLLSYGQQMTYDILLEYFTNEIYGLENSIYYEPLAPVSGIQGELPVAFSEFSFRTREDVEICLSLLADVDDYFNELFLFEKKKVEQGCFMNENAFEQVVGQCLDIAENADDFYLIGIFKDKLSRTSFLTDSEKAEYSDRYAAAVRDDFVPAYRRLYDNLMTLKSFCHTVNPRTESDWVEYYKYLVKAYTGSEKSPEELITAIMNSLKLNMRQLYSSALQNADVFKNFENYIFPYSGEPDRALEYMIENMNGIFPAPKTTSFKVKNVHPSLESLMSPAFYLLPPIDNLNENVIYINRSEEYKDMELFAVLAHEGYPGHLYQTTYFNSTNPHPIRQTLDFAGYTEGWAKYAEMYAYDFAGNYRENPLDTNTADLFRLNEIIGFALYSRVDLGVNYEGWSKDKAREFLAEYGFEDKSVADKIYYTVLNDPGVYLQYYIGYLEIMELRNYAMEKMGDDFSQYKFHHMLLSAGPCSFRIIKEYIDNYLDLT